MIVDAENDVDGRPRAKRLPGLPHGFLEDAAAVDPMRDEAAGKGLCETRQEPFDPLAGVGKRFQGDEQEFSGRRPAAVLLAGAHSKLARGAVINRAKIDASNLRRRLGEKRDTAAHRLLS